MKFTHSGIDSSYSTRENVCNEGMSELVLNWALWCFFVSWFGTTSSLLSKYVCKVKNETVVLDLENRHPPASNNFVCELLSE